MPAARIFRLARTRRWAIVASGARKARAISGVWSPAPSAPRGEQAHLPACAGTMRGGVLHVDVELPAVGQHHAERVRDGFLDHLGLAEDLNVHHVRVADQQAAQHAARMIGGGRPGLTGVIERSPPATSRPRLPPLAYSPDGAQT